MRLKDKVALITGAGAGLGKATALRFAQEGAKVVVAEINEANGSATAAAIRQSQGIAEFVQTDISQEESIKALVAATIKRFSRIDVLFNNAAVLFHKHDARAHELSTEIWDKTHTTNLRGVWLTSKYVIPWMLQQGGGSIIHLASPTGMSGCAPGLTAYSSSKGGVHGLSRVMAIDYAQEGIRVNVVVPGFTLTPIVRELVADPKVYEWNVQNIPLKRGAEPVEIAGAVAFLASDDASYMTGSFMFVDGGLTAA